MKLTELKPTFLTREDDKSFRMTDDITKADGVEFLCPVCFKANNGPVGTHAIICWAPHVPQTTNPTPGRWNLNGTGYGDLTLTAGSSSILLRTAPGAAHFHVTNGEII